MQRGIDCSTSLTSVIAKAIKNAGYDCVMRYLGTTWKTMDKKEADLIQAAGLKLVSVFEKNATYDSYFTPEQGEKDARDAMRYAQAVGQPHGSAIYFAVDYGGGNANVGKIKEYFRAIRRTLKDYKVGGYGSYVVVKYLDEQGLLDYVWQTCAWSNGKIHENANMHQYVIDQRFAGIGVDFNYIYKSPGAWGEGDELTVNQYEELKAAIDKVEKMVTGLVENDAPADDYAKAPIEWAKDGETRISTGERPQGLSKREEVITMIKNHDDRIQKQLKNIKVCTCGK